MDEANSPRPVGVVHMRPADLANASRIDTAALARQAAALIDAMVALAPLELRARFRTELEDPVRSASFSGSTQPEIARLGSLLAGIRITQLEAEATKPSSAGEATEAELVRVRVALVPSLGAERAVRATVIRRPGDGGRPLLLLDENRVTARDLAAGLRAAAIAVRRYGPDPKGQVRFNVRATSRPHRESLVNDNYVAFLRKSAKMDIPGVGLVRATDMMTRAR